MKKIFTLIFSAGLVCTQSKAQLMLNELYTDPGAGKHEFFELYNTSTATASANNLTIVTFFEISGTKGFYVMDLPNHSISSRGYYVGSSALPFNYQGIIGSTQSDFNWNSAAFTSNEGSLKKWVPGVANLFDGNLFYDQQPIPANFNDFFYRRTASGASYTVFLYQNGILINSFCGGTGGNTTILTAIVNMPDLFVDMAGTSTDFSIKFSGYASVPIEYCTQDAGSDNGYIREGDGQCGAWVKSSAQIQHTPKAPNGYVDGNDGTIAVESSLARGTAATGSTITYNVISAPGSAFPITLNIYWDNGIVTGLLDSMDTYFATNIENVLSDGPFTTLFFPYNANILIVVKSALGCVDKVIFVPNAPILSVKLEAFSGRLVNNNVSLSWTVSENSNAFSFEVERSYDGSHFQSLATITATTQPGNASYSYNDKLTTANRAVYRIKVNSKTGRSFYSAHWTCQLGMQAAPDIRILGNPVKSVLFLDVAEAKHVQLVIVNSTGVKVSGYNYYPGHEGGSILQVPLPATMSKGIYFLKLLSGDVTQTIKFIKD
jgi:hypothetical protein